MKKIIGFAFGILLLNLGLVGCAPRDLPVETPVEVLANGEAVEASKYLGRLPSCPDDKQDWTDLRLHPKDFEEAVGLGSAVYIKLGSYNCMREGARLDIITDYDNPVSVAKADILKITMVRWRDLIEDTVKFLPNKVSVSSFEKAKARLESNFKKEHRGVVTLTYFRYVKGTAKNESELKEKFSAPAVEVVEEGERLSTCTSDKDWDSIIIPKDYHESIFNDKLSSWVRPGDRNCLRVNSNLEIAIKTAPDSDAPNCGLVKVTSIVKMPLPNIVESDIIASKDFDFVEYMNYVKKGMKPQFDNMITITNFEFVKDSQLGKSCL